MTQKKDTEESEDQYSSSDREAQRLLALAVMFENASTPIPSNTLRETIYRDVSSDESARKAFMRDRQKLVLCGLTIKKDPTQGVDPGWMLDTNSYAGEISLTKEDAVTLSVACATLVNDPSFPYANELRLALTKIDRYFDLERTVGTNPATRNVATTRTKLENCAAEGHPVRITYERADGSTVQRTVGICGFFPLQGNTYVVGKLIGKNEEPHSYNLARVSKVTPKRGETFAVPEDFDITRFVKLPFQLGPTLYTGAFLVPSKGKRDVEISSRGQGQWEPLEHERDYLWKVEISDTLKAASWAIAQAIRPTTPKELVDAWQSILRESIHNAQKEE